MSSDSITLKWTPWGGVGEIGMNCMVLECGERAIPIDAGVMFSDANDYGIQSVFADFEQLLQKYQPKEWLITHVHEDHIGAVPYIFLCASHLNLPAPTIYAPPLAAELIKEKIKDLLPFRMQTLVDQVRSVPVGETLALGNISVTFIGVAHSAPQSTALALEWRADGRSEPVKILHTGDFKDDATQSRRGLIFDDKWKSYRPDLMFVDSTNANRKGHSIAESEIEIPLKKILETSPGRVFVTMFSSNAERVGMLTRLAHQCRRRVGLAGRSLQTMMKLSAQVGVFEGKPYEPEVFCDVTELSNLELNKQLIVCSGSQGEMRSVLNRMSLGIHPDFYVKPEDTIVFSSKVIPGNEKSIYRMINRLMAQGARVIWEEGSSGTDYGHIHASGHGRRDEIKNLLTWIDPQILIPVHGNVFQMKEVEVLARELAAQNKLSDVRIFSAENGDSFEFDLDVSGLKDPVKSRWTDYLPKFLRFDNFVAPSLDPFLRIRKRAAMGGVVSIMMDQGGRFRTRILGVAPTTGPRQDLQEKIQKLVDDFCHSTFRQLSKQWPYGEKLEQMESELADSLSRDLRKLMGTKPAIVVHLVGL